MLGNLLFQLRRALPDFPGRQRLFRACDRMGGPFVARTSDDVRLRVFVSSFMDALYFEPRPEATSDAGVLGAELARLQPGDVFVDVGANIGAYSIRAARRVGPSGLVLAFEPSRREYQRLLANLELNGASGVVPFAAALGADPGLLALHVAPTHTGLNTLGVAPSAAHAFREARTERVPVLRFDDVARPLLAGRRVRLLKIDVEGAEMDVLLGMRASLQACLFDTLVVEITPDFLRQFGHSKEALYALLAGCGYRPRFASTAAQYDEVFTR